MKTTPKEKMIINLMEEVINILSTCKLDDPEFSMYDVMKDAVENEELVLDTSGTECPIPVLKARKLASELNKDTIIKIIATDPLAEADFEHYCDQSNYEYLSCEKIKDKIVIRYRFKIKN